VLLGIALVVGLQVRLWFSDVGIVARHGLQSRLADQQAHSQELAARNAQLAREVVALKSGLSAVEARARSELGMVKQGETFYLVTPK
jgi:cell division protein FtsB